MNFNPDQIMNKAFNIMLRAAGTNLERAWIRWRMQHLSGDRNRMAVAKRNLAAGNIGNCLEKKRRNHLRAGVRPLANGVA